MAFTIHLRILDEKTKTKFSHFNIEKVRKFELPEELQSFLLEEHLEVVKPADTINFKMGYFQEGRGNRKFDIVDKNTLEQAYKNSSYGRICLWIDPYVKQHDDSKVKRKKKSKANKANKKSKKNSSDSSASDDSDDSDDNSSKRTRDEKKGEKNFRTLKEKFSGQWPDYKLSSWATMVALGSHNSLENPPTTAYFDLDGGKKKQKESWVSDISSAVAACVSTGSPNNSLLQ